MNQRTAIVTGATGGIGSAIAEKLISEKYFVVLVDVDKSAGINMQNRLKNNSVFMHCDITNENQVANLFSELKAKFKTLNALVNNAGIIRDNVIWNMPVEDFDSVLDVNLKGTWLMCREAAKWMKQQEFGRIINITSRAWLGNKGQSNYSASKAGVVALTRVLALELGSYNVLVNAIAPGLIDTPMTQKLPDHVLQKLIAVQPTKQMGTPNDVAHVVDFLCKEQTKFITGQTIYVDGGKSIGGGL